MLKNKIDVFEFPTNLGLRKKENESEPDVKEMPVWLATHGLYSKLNIDKIVSLPAFPYSLDFDIKKSILNEKQVINFAKKQANILDNQWHIPSFKLIIGGDCSVLIGTGLSLNKNGTFGLFFLDGHTDFITPELSKTGGIAGMDLALVTGHGEKSLTNISGLKPYFEEENVFCVGNRELEDSYVEPILNSKINYFDLHDIRQSGVKQISKSFLNMVKKQAMDGFIIHLDVDVINDELMPAVDSREKGGLNYQELFELLNPLVHHSLCIGMEITILDPSLDKTGKVTKNFIEFLSNLIAAEFNN